MKMIISGGGTGGHIFPAIAIAKSVLAIRPDTEILFVGALGKMEMEKVPAAGFKIIGLPIVGLQRRITWKNLLVPLKVFQSMWKARSIVRQFQPDVAVGVGGYASGPLLRAASTMGIATIIQEQNSYPGLTNRILSKKVDRICVAYEGLEKYFPKKKIIHTGNPVRPELNKLEGKEVRAMAFFRLVPNMKTILVIGGSLGARTVNHAVRNALSLWKDEPVQIIWQTGKTYFAEAVALAKNQPHVHVYEFIKEMDLAYAAAQIIISRAGAMSIAELCLVKKPVILIPSPNVAEDHQTKNAKALSSRGAAILISDIDAEKMLGIEAKNLWLNEALCIKLSDQIAHLARPNAARDIATEVLLLADKSKTN